MRISRPEGLYDGIEATGAEAAVAERWGSGVVSREIAGTVVEQLPSALYRVRLDEGGQVTAHAADVIERNFIRLLVGDRVRLELSPLDGRRGRIVEKVL